MPVRALIVDLDNTLVPEMANYERAFDDGCRAIAVEHELDVSALRRSVFDASHALWRGSRWSSYCLRLGLGSPTSLLTDLGSGRAEQAELRNWLPLYRRLAWDRGLAAHRIDPDARDALGRRLDEAFRARQRTYCPPYADALAGIERVTRQYRLAITTNGPGDVQRAKLSASGLERYFPVVIVSEEIGSGKPDVEMFHIALDRLAVGAHEAVVVGDSHERDIIGAQRAGIASILVDRGEPQSKGAPVADRTIARLTDLPSAIAEVSSAHPTQRRRG